MVASPNANQKSTQTEFRVITTMSLNGELCMKLQESYIIPIEIKNYLKHHKARNCDIILLDRQFCVWPGGRFWGRKKEEGEHLRHLTANPMWVIFCSELCCLNLKILNICFMPGNLVFQTLIYMITLLNSFFTAL